MAVGQRPGGDWRVVRMQRNIEDGRNRKQTFVRQKRHCVPPKSLATGRGPNPAPLSPPVRNKPATPHGVSLFSLTVGRNEAGAQRRVGGERTNSSVGGISHPAVRGMGADAAGLPAQADGRALRRFTLCAFPYSSFTAAPAPKP